MDKYDTCVYQHFILDKYSGEINFKELKSYSLTHNSKSSTCLNRLHVSCGTCPTFSVDNLRVSSLMLSSLICLEFMYVCMYLRIWRVRDMDLVSFRLICWRCCLFSSMGVCLLASPTSSKFRWLHGKGGHGPYEVYCFSNEHIATLPSKCVYLFS